MMFPAIKTEDGVIKGKVSFCCRMLKVTRQGFYKYPADMDRPWKYRQPADAMRTVVSEDECSDTCGRIRMYQALLLKQPEGVRIPSERTACRIMEETGPGHRPKHRPSGITRADREARKSGDLLKRDFKSREPLKKCITDITGIKARDGKPYVSAIFDCFDAAVPGMAMDTNMKAVLCGRALTSAVRSCPALRGAVIHSGRGSQYASETCRRAAAKHGILQGMNSAGGRCHDNARCESMRARMKEELIYGRHDTERMTAEELKTLIWRYFISYWNNRSNGHITPLLPNYNSRRHVPSYTGIQFFI